MRGGEKGERREKDGRTAGRWCVVYGTDGSLTHATNHTKPPARIWSTWSD